MKEEWKRVGNIKFKFQKKNNNKNKRGEMTRQERWILK